MRMNVKKYVASLSDEDLVSEVLCWNIPAGLSEDELCEMIKERRIKSVAVNSTVDACLGDAPFLGISPVEIPVR